MSNVTIVGGGLAGCEAAWQLARRGHGVTLIEMRPGTTTPVHRTALLGELVCSNSLKSEDPIGPSGVLKAELRRLGSLVLAAADAHRVPAGEALAVDRAGFARALTLAVAGEPRIRLERRRLAALPAGPAILATGPLTDGPLAAALERLTGTRLAFYDAIAPIVDGASLDWSRAFRGSRWGRHLGAGSAEGDYVNCPLDRDEYDALVTAIRDARKVAPRPFEEPRYFDACLPIEVIAERGWDALAHGPLRPVGLDDPRQPPSAPQRPRWTPGRGQGRDGQTRRDTGPVAVVQLRPEDSAGVAYNIVGFQTRLTYPEQERVFRLVPALAHAELLRKGSVHRNSFVDAPRVLDAELRLRARPELSVAGQLAGVEGYVESVAAGMLAALHLAARLEGRTLPPAPPTTAVGALVRHLTAHRDRFEPTGIHLGLFPPMPGATKDARRKAVAEKAKADFEGWSEKTA